MPDMDGLELAQAIKGNLNISHIPFILLTAKTDIESKLEALELGVDDYITKPFSLDFLEARIENLLRIRSQLQVYFKSTLTSGIITLSKSEITNLDDVFIKKTMLYLEENYENPTMNIDDLATSTGLSRSSFFKKTKSLTGLAPVEFIREFRIQKATQLIEAGETNISQLAFNVGINDTRFFRRYFKEKYGMNPSDYISKKSSKDSVS
jgi:YesN/AraC family two-component response regulator